MHAHSCAAVITTLSIVACAEPGGTARQAEAAETQPRQAIASEVVPGAQAGRMIVRPVGELRFDNVQRDVAVISGDPANRRFHRAAPLLQGRQSAALALGGLSRGRHPRDGEALGRR